MRSAFIFLVVMIVFAGCGSEKRVVVAKKQELPSWYQSSSMNTNTELYSVGEGQTKQDAITDALSMMISTLSVSISSQFNSKSVIKEGQTSSNTATYTNEVQSDVAKIHISNYELVHSKNIGFKKYIVLVKSNKKQLFDSLKQETDQEISLINSKKYDLANQNTIKQISVYRGFKETLSSVPNRLLVMGVLKSSFDESPYLFQISSIEKKYDELVASLSFSISANSNASNLKSAISQGISSQQLKVAEGSGVNHYKIYINSKIEKASSYGFTLARSAIYISVEDHKGVIIGSNKLNITGQSTQGYEIAKENVASKLNEMVKKEGILEVIGLKI